MAFTSRLKKPCLAKLLSIWSKKPIPVSISAFPTPSISSVSLISVSLVFLDISAIRSDIPFTPYLCSELYTTVPYDIFIANTLALNFRRNGTKLENTSLSTDVSKWFAYKNIICHSLTLLLPLTN